MSHEHARSLGDILLLEKGLDAAKLEEALLQLRREPGLDLGETLVRLGSITDEELAWARAIQVRVPLLELDSTPVNPSVLWRLPRSVAEQHLMLPVREEADGSVLLVMADPSNDRAAQAAEFALNARVSRATAPSRRIRQAILRHYSMEPVAQRMLRGVPQDQRVFNVAPTLLELNPVTIQEHLRQGGTQVYVELVNFILINAIERGASDIHLEPQADGFRLRLRIDGMLREALKLPGWAQDPIVSRIKVVGRMDVAERRRPQDGKVSVTLGDRKLDLRISSLPSQYGENVVIRLLDPKMIQVGLDELGWRRVALNAWYRMVSSPRGLVLVVGPTGSGKSTTLYATIHRLNQENTSIVTIEDPVEYAIDGITQVQVNERAGVTFAGSIRSLLRQDPNVLVIGEIRDPVTANTAVDAATTGHLVLSTLHTSNTIGAITRLLDLDVPPFMLGSAITGVVSQRLVRRVCPDCSLPAEATPEDWGRLRLPPMRLGTSARRAGPGCPRCQYQGYSGRIGLYEVLPVDPALAAAIQAGNAEAELWGKAMDSGMVTIFEDALIRVNEGVTTLEELARVIPVNDYPAEVVERSLLQGRKRPAEIEVADLELIDAPILRTGRPVVLAVDDAEEVLQVVNLALEDDCEVRLARDGQEALDEVARSVPDLVVLDVMMPRLSGYEVCQTLRDDPATARLPVIFLSARGETAHIKKGFYAGADDYLPKPFDPEELGLRVKALLRRSGWRL